MPGTASVIRTPGRARCRGLRKDGAGRRRQESAREAACRRAVSAQADPECQPGGTAEGHPGQAMQEQRGGQLIEELPGSLSRIRAASGVAP